MMADQLTEQQGQLTSILAQQKELANDINQLQGQLTAKKELFNKTQGVVEYLQTIGVTLPEPPATTPEEKTEVVE